MQEFQAKKKVRRLIYSKGVIAFLIFSFILLANATWNVFKKSKESAANVAQSVSELERMQEREQILTSEIERLSTEKGIEEEIRSKFSVSKPGEELLVIIDEEATTTVEVAQPEGWWTKFKKIFR